MPYKTKFREVQMPQTREDFAALGADANSMRSFGAAFYRSFVRNLPVNTRGQTVVALYEQVILPLILETNPGSLPKRE